MENYEFLGLLGKGGFGEVWKVRRKKDNKIIALKKMLIQSSRARDLAKKEATFLKELSEPACYPSLVCYYDSFILNDALYIEMEYIDGETLNTFVAKRRNDPKLTNYLIAIMTDLLPGLMYLHSKGIIHRDIKPENIMIDAKNQPKIIDIGLACDYRNDICKNQCCFGAAGTPFFMAPETLINKVSYISSDTWSLGATMFYLLMGRHVFEPSQQSMKALKEAARENEPPIIRSGNSKLDNAINSMLEKDHTARIGENELLISLLKDQNFSSTQIAEFSKKNNLNL